MINNPQISFQFSYSGRQIKLKTRNKPKIENRIQVLQLDVNSFEIQQGQLFLKDEKDVNMMGSGCLVKLDFNSNQQQFCILTAGHNLIRIFDRRNQKIYRKIKYIKFCYQQLETGKSSGELKGDLWEVYEKYMIKPETYYGNDFGIVWLASNLFLTQYTNSQYVQFGKSIEELNVNVGEKICLIGYPGEYDGKLFKMEGTIYKIENTIEGQCLLYYNDIDTTIGQSGGGIYLMRENDKQMTYYLISIHIGYDDEFDANVGIAFNSKMIKWIKEKYEKRVQSKNSQLNIQNIVNFKTDSIESCLGLIEVTDQNSKVQFGTSCLINHAGIENKYIITTAHNLFNIFVQNNQKKIEKINKIVFYSKNKESQQFFSGIGFQVAPQYFNKSDPYYGFDIAIVRLDAIVEIKNNLFKLENQLQLKEKDQIELYGYNKIHSLNSIKTILENIETLPNGQILLFYDNLLIETTFSGAPIFIRSDNQLKLIGIHIGFDQTINKFFGTALNDFFFKMINSQSDEDFPQTFEKSYMQFCIQGGSQSQIKSNKNVSLLPKQQQNDLIQLAPPIDIFDSEITNYLFQSQYGISQLSNKVQIDQLKEFRTQVKNVDCSQKELMQGQLQMINEMNHKLVGSGILVQFREHYFILTAAHNFINIQPRLYQNVQISIKQAKYFTSRFSFNNYFAQLEGTSYTIYDNYLQSPEIWEGCDMALMFFKQNKKILEHNAPPIEKLTEDNSIEKLNIKIGENICVIGYPGEYDGQLFKMMGTIHNLEQLNNKNSLIYYKDIQTSEGQSGAAIYLIRENNWILIGIHLGFDVLQEANVGIGISNCVLNWIENICLQQFTL